MHCYFNLVSPHQSIIDEDGIAVADADEARTFAREVDSEMVQDGVAEIAHWRGSETAHGGAAPGGPSRRHRPASIATAHGIPPGTGPHRR